MAERSSEAVEKQAVRDGAAAYLVEAETVTMEDVPRGYKRTEVGVIPEDWKVEPLGEYVTITSGESPSLLVFSSDGFPYFKVEQLGNSEKYLVVGSTPYHFSEGKTVASGSLIFAKRGAAIALNKVRLLGSASFMDTNLMALTPNENLEREYLYYQLGYIGLWRFADTTSVPQINNKHVKPLPFPLPREEEQRAIATALSDADALIESLDNLIAKKRAIKQAAMQQLLTGQTRLPGFTGEWETKRLGDVASFHKGKSLSKSDLRADGAKPCIHYGELFTQYGEKITGIKSRTDPKDSFFTSVKNDVLMPTSDVTPNGLATASCVIEPDVILGGDILVIRPNEGQIDGVFLAYKVRIDHRQIMQLVSGTTVFHIYARDMANFIYEAPRVDEQRAIVSALSDIDTEVENLERRRDKARQIKQGMMQQLLTGRVRLVEGNRENISYG